MGAPNTMNVPRPQAYRPQGWPRRSPRFHFSNEQNRPLAPMNGGPISGPGLPFNIQRMYGPYGPGPGGPINNGPGQGPVGGLGPNGPMGMNGPMGPNMVLWE